MPWFRCLARGENFLLRVDGELTLMGFYTTRWVEAEDAQAAERSALGMLKSDPFLADWPVEQRNSEARVYFDGVEPLEVKPLNATNNGFTFFPMMESGDGC